MDGWMNGWSLGVEISKLIDWLRPQIIDCHSAHPQLWQWPILTRLDQCPRTFSRKTICPVHHLGSLLKLRLLRVLVQWWLILAMVWICVHSITLSRWVPWVAKIIDNHLLEALRRCTITLATLLLSNLFYLKKYACTRYEFFSFCTNCFCSTRVWLASFGLESPLAILLASPLFWVRLRAVGALPPRPPSRSGDNIRHLFFRNEFNNWAQVLTRVQSEHNETSQANHKDTVGHGQEGCRRFVVRMELMMVVRRCRMETSTRSVRVHIAGMGSVPRRWWHKLVEPTQRWPRRGARIGGGGQAWRVHTIRAVHVDCGEEKWENYFHKKDYEFSVRRQL